MDLALLGVLPHNVSAESSLGTDSGDRFGASGEDSRTFKEGGGSRLNR